MKTSAHPSIWFMKQEERWLESGDPEILRSFSQSIVDNEIVSDGSEPVIFFCCSQLATVEALRTYVQSLVFVDSFTNETFLSRLTDPLFSYDVFASVLQDYVASGNLDNATIDGETALIRSIKVGDVGKTSALLSNGATILRGQHLNIPNPRPAVLYGFEEYEAIAAERNNTATLEMLKKYGLTLTSAEKERLCDFALAIRKPDCVSFIRANF